MKNRRLPLTFSLLLLTAGSMGIAVAQTPIEIFLCAELVTISTFYIFFTVIIPALHPKADLNAIFIGGAAKSPYISSTELFSPGIPVIKEELDDSWDLYFDKKSLKTRSNEVDNTS
ncbi:MAG: hypothetical protein ACUVTM_00790 [Candidatus Bathyarchaeia archaeon]